MRAVIPIGRHSGAVFKLMENLAAVEAWRATLTETQLQRITRPQCCEITGATR